MLDTILTYCNSRLLITLPRNIFYIISFLAFLPHGSYSLSLSEIRELYLRAINNSASADTLYKLFVDDFEVPSSPEKSGYAAMSHFMKAKHALNPAKKYAEFNLGREQLELTIAKHNSNAELRYLRLAIQLNCPSLLGYNDFVDLDKKFLLQQAVFIKDKQLLGMIVDFLNKSNLLTNSEKARLYNRSN